jgi:LCP family protein required for cell wall assembly
VTTPPPAPLRTVRHARRSRPGYPPRHARGLHAPVLRWVGIATTGLFAFVLAGSAAAYSQIQGNITQYDVTDLLGDRPAAEAAEVAPDDALAGRDLNILVMGSDARTGAFLEAEGDPGGMRADTTFVLHVSADRTRVDVVNIPRDLLVDIPSCELSTGGSSKAQSDAMFNSAFSIGGAGGEVAYAAACTWKTVELMTGLTIDDFVVVDFAGFISMVNARGGVPICIPEDVDDTGYTGLVLAAGQQELTGEQAFLYARTRHGIGDGSDISRIGRQQKLVGAMVRELLSQNLLTDLPKLYLFLDAATQSLTTGTTVGDLTTIAGLANSVRTMQAGAVSFVTVPFDWAGARVKPNAASADLWAALVADQPISPQTPVVEPTTPTDAATTTDPGTATDPVPPVTTDPAPDTTVTTPPVEDLEWDSTTAADADVCG